MADFHPDPHELDEHNDLFDYEHTAVTSSAGTDPQLFDDSSNVNPTATIIDTEKPLSEQQPESYEYEDPKDAQRTISMTVFFLVFMVLYIGFCCYYRKVKTRRTVGDTGQESLSRQQRRSENRAVMDESMTASSRARQSEEEAKKMDERKENIKRALLSRLIVDETEAEQEGGKKKKIYSDDNTNVACEGNNENCSCERCQYWNWENVEEGKMQTKQEGIAAVVDEVELTAATNAAAVAIAASNQRGAIIAIQEESDEDEEEENENQPPRDVEEATGNAKAQDEKNDIEAQTLDSNENKVPLSSPTSSPLPSPSSSPRSSPRALHPVSPPTTPSRLSLSLDALNCGNRKSPMDALNCGSTSSRLLNCSNHTITCNINAGKHKSNSPNKSTYRTISLSAIIGTYGEECNICLSQFQVGDRAAWSKHQSVMDDDPAATISVVAAAQDEKEISDCQNDSEHSNNVQGCRHIFHEECISRWLLVRDGCPICRRTYFPEEVEEESGTGAAVPDVIEERDLEIGMVGLSE